MGGSLLFLPLISERHCSSKVMAGGTVDHVVLVRGPDNRGSNVLYILIVHVVGVVLLYWN